MTIDLKKKNNVFNVHAYNNNAIILNLCKNSKKMKFYNK